MSLVWALGNALRFKDFDLRYRRRVERPTETWEAVLGGVSLSDLNLVRWCWGSNFGLFQYVFFEMTKGHRKCSIVPGTFPLTQFTEKRRLSFRGRRSSGSSPSVRRPSKF